MALTIGGLLLDARNLINDETEPLRNSDLDLVTAFNDALLQIRYRRPELFLPLGLRNPVPYYSMPADAGTPFPISASTYTPCMFYLAALMDLKDDTFGDDKRAAALLTRFSQMLMTVQ